VHIRLTNKYIFVKFTYPEQYTASQMIKVILHLITKQQNKKICIPGVHKIRHVARGHWTARV